MAREKKIVHKGTDGECVKAHPELINIEAWIPSAKIDNDDIAFCQRPDLGKDVIPECAIEARKGAYHDLSPVLQLHLL